jgi:hypothetical protein
LEPIIPRLIQDLIAGIRRLRLGWLHHNNIRILCGLFPSDSNPAIKAQGSVLALSGDSLPFRWPEYLEDVYDDPDESFALFKIRRGHPPEFIGVGFKRFGPNNQPTLYWIKRSDLTRSTYKIEEEFLKAMQPFTDPIIVKPR